MLNLSQTELGALEASLLNLSGNIPLHNRFRALFTLKALKSDEAVRIISKGEVCSQRRRHGQRSTCIQGSRIPLLSSSMSWRTA